MGFTRTKNTLLVQIFCQIDIVSLMMYRSDDCYSLQVLNLSYEYILDFFSHHVFNNIASSRTVVWLPMAVIVDTINITSQYVSSDEDLYLV